MNAPEPEATPDRRRILLAVTGLSPQIVTETVYALSQGSRPAWVPTEVHLITTSRGADNARLRLLSDEPGWFHRLRRDYDLPAIAFTPEHIHVIRRPDGSALDDIRNDDDNRLAADAIAECVRTLTADEDAQVHASIAGGRKSMGFYLGYAMSLYGRQQDRLSHVLVSAPYESHPEFFYPTPTTRVIERLDRTQEALDTRDAKVWLGDIPFVRLRHGLPRALLDGPGGFALAVDAAQARLGPPRLDLLLSDSSIMAGGTRVALAPADFAFLVWFARRAQAGLEPLACPSASVPNAQYAASFLAEYSRLRAADDQARRRYSNGMSKDDFLERKSKLRRALVDALGDAAARPYLIQGSGRPMRYQLTLDRQSIRFG